MLMLCFLFRQVAAQITSVCSSSSPSYPGMSVVWVSSQKNWIKGARAPGTLHFETIGGVETQYTMDSTCEYVDNKPLVRADSTSNLARHTNALKTSKTCQALTLEGTTVPLLPSDAVLTCYGPEQPACNQPTKLPQLASHEKPPYSLTWAAVIGHVNDGGSTPKCAAAYAPNIDRTWVAMPMLGMSSALLKHWKTGYDSTLFFQQQVNYLQSIGESAGQPCSSQLSDRSLFAVTIYDGGADCNTKPAVDNVNPCSLNSCDGGYGRFSSS